MGFAAAPFDIGMGNNNTSFLVSPLLLWFCRRHDSPGCACESSDLVDINASLVIGPIRASLPGELQIIPVTALLISNVRTDGELYLRWD
jgi:hypothetical protein